MGARAVVVAVVPRRRVMGHEFLSLFFYCVLILPHPHPCGLLVRGASAWCGLAIAFQRGMMCVWWSVNEPRAPLVARGTVAFGMGERWRGEYDFRAPALFVPPLQQGFLSNPPLIDQDRLRRGLAGWLAGWLACWLC